MNCANSTLDDEGDVDDTTTVSQHRKCLSLEARHSKAIEYTRKIRANLPASIFMPKQPVKSQLSPRPTSNTSPKKSPEQGASLANNQSFHFTPPHDKDDKNKLIPRPDLKSKLKSKQNNSKGYEQKNVIQTKLWLPSNPHTSTKSDKAQNDRSIENELKSMGLEVSSDMEEDVENALANGTSSSSIEEVVKILSLDETKTHDTEQPIDVDIAKSTETANSIQEKQTRKKQTKIVDKRNGTEEIITEIPAKFSSYDDSLGAVKEFQDFMQIISTSLVDREINQNLMELQSSINEFSEFLFKTYKNLELLEKLPRRFHRNPNTPETQLATLTQPSPEYVVRIDVPNVMEQIITYNATEILQHTKENCEKNERMRQKRESTKKQKVKKSAKHNKKTHSDTMDLKDCKNRSSAQRKSPRKQIQDSEMPHPAFRNQSMQIEQRATTTHTEATTVYPTNAQLHPQSKAQNESALSSTADCRNNSHSGNLWNPFIEPTIHPAFRNATPLGESNSSPTQQCAMPQQEHIVLSHSLTPDTTNSNTINVNLQGVTNNTQYPLNTNHHQTSASSENYSPTSKNILRPSVIQQPPRQFNIPYPVTPTDSRDFFAAQHSPTSNPILTPPQSTDCQSSQIYRPPPPPYYLHSGFNQSHIVPITPPSEDVRYEATQQHQTPIVFPPALGVYNQDRWPYIYKDVGETLYMSHLKSALNAPVLYPQTYGQF